MKMDLMDTSPVATLEGDLLIGSVGFSGEVNGILHVHVTDTFARLMTGSAHGKKPEEIKNPADVNDTVREVSNMIGGNLKSLLSENGFACVLSIPSVARGGNPKVEPTSVAQSRPSSIRRLFNNPKGEPTGGVQQERLVFRHPAHNTFVIVETSFS